MNTPVPIEIPAWLLMLMPISLIILLIVIILVVLNINKSRGSNSTKNEEGTNLIPKEQGFTHLIEKKDILYWLLISCLGTIALITFRYKDANEVISHWSFAGTIVSIILAVIAIGFTLFQTLSSNLSSEKIAESAEIIYKASEELNSSELSKSSEIINNAAKDLVNYKAFIELSIGEVQNELGSLKTHQVENFDEIRESLTTSMNQGNGKNDTSENKYIFDINVKDFFGKTYLQFPEDIRTYLYAYMYIGQFNDYDGLEFISSELVEELVKTTSLYENSDDDLNSFKEGTFFGISISYFQMCYAWLINFEIIEKFQKLSQDERQEILVSMKDSVKKEVIKMVENI